MSKVDNTNRGLCPRWITQTYQCHDDCFLWWRTSDGNVRLYYPYRQYTKLSISRFVSLRCNAAHYMIISQIKVCVVTSFIHSGYILSCRPQENQIAFEQLLISFMLFSPHCPILWHFRHVIYTYIYIYIYIYIYTYIYIYIYSL